MGKVLVLRTCDAELRSYGGFQWPKSGPVEAPDWQKTYRCGNGLHGLLWGEGNGGYLEWGEAAKWLVVEVYESNLLTGKGDLVDKCKFRRGKVVHVGDRKSATDYIAANGGAGKAIVGGTATAGDRGTATAGDRGTATAGDRGTATAGYRGTATAGDGGTATAGDGGTATAGDYGTATAGDGGTATAGDGGTATAGDGGTIQVGYWDGKRYRIITGYVGEDGIKPNAKYRVVDVKLKEVE